MGRAKARGRARLSPWRERLKSLLTPRAWLDPWTFAFALALLLSALAHYVWVGALCAELALHLGLVALASACGWLVARRWLRGGVLAAFAVAFCAPLWPYVRPSLPTPEHGPVFRVVQQHVAGGALSPGALQRWLIQQDADLVSLTGLAHTAGLLAEGSGYRSVPGADARHALLLARTKLVAPAPAKSAALVRIGRCSVGLTQVVLPSLFDARSQTTRRAAIGAIEAAPVLARQLYVGYFGSRSAADDLASLRTRHALRDARLGHGVLATALPSLGPLGLPLNQVLLRGWILVRRGDVQPPIVPGAHRALTFDLELTEPRCAAAKTR